MARGSYTGSRRDNRRPVVNNLISSVSGLNNHEVVLAVGSSKTVAFRNYAAPGQERSWNRGMNSAGPLELPYVGTLPTIGLIKKRGMRGHTVGA